MTDLFDNIGRTAEEAAAREIPGIKGHPGERLAEQMHDAHTLVRTSDPDTSAEAAESISPRIRALQEKVLAFAATAPDGFTDVAMNRHFDTTGSTYRTRRSELVEKGLIRDSGERHCYGADGKGRRHIIWQITLEGLKANKA